MARRPSSTKLDNLNPDSGHWMDRMNLNVQRMNVTLKWGLQKFEVTRMFQGHEYPIEKIDPVIESITGYLGQLNYSPSEIENFVYTPRGEALSENEQEDAYREHLRKVHIMSDEEIEATFHWTEDYKAEMREFYHKKLEALAQVDTGSVYNPFKPLLTARASGPGPSSDTETTPSINH